MYQLHALFVRRYSMHLRNFFRPVSPFPWRDFLTMPEFFRSFPHPHSTVYTGKTPVSDDGRDSGLKHCVSKNIPLTTEGIKDPDTKGPYSKGPFT